jgi:hypothetical protein
MDDLLVCVVNCGRGNGSERGIHCGTPFEALHLIFDSCKVQPPIPHLDGSMPDVKIADNNSNASGFQPTLSNGLLNSDAADQQRERGDETRCQDMVPNHVQGHD